MISCSMLSPRLPSSNACSLNRRKEKKTQKKAQKNKKKPNFYPSETQEGCSKLHITNKKIKRVVLKGSYEV